MKLKVKKINNDLELKYATDGSSGIDITLIRDVKYEDFLICEQDDEMPFESVANIPCGFCVEIPSGFEGQIRPRSSATKKGINVHFGTIDSDYRGEVYIQASLICPEIAMDICESNADEKVNHLIIKKGTRIAQLVICPVVKCDIEYCSELSMTQRGEGKFGSTGD